MISGGGGLLKTEEGESETETEIWLDAVGSLVAGCCEGERGGGAGPSEAGIGERYAGDVGRDGELPPRAEVGGVTGAASGE